VKAWDFLARWRVRLGYILAAVILWLARPTPGSILLGAGIGIVGLAIRACAAGFLHKQEVLTTSGPYAHTRNPLYLGSSFLAVGAAIASHSLVATALLLLYFALVYSLVMRREAMELRLKHGATFDAYAAAVPLFFPRLSAAKPREPTESFSWQRYRKNHEYQAVIGFGLLLIVLAVIGRLRTH
jgi:protein-S-isoprenylcysteine O-methyltransferase Ste14